MMAALSFASFRSGYMKSYNIWKLAISARVIEFLNWRNILQVMRPTFSWEKWQQAPNNGICRTSFVNCSIIDSLLTSDLNSEIDFSSTASKTILFVKSVVTRFCRDLEDLSNVVGDINDRQVATRFWYGADDYLRIKWAYSGYDPEIHHLHDLATAAEHFETGEKYCCVIISASVTNNMQSRIPGSQTTKLSSKYPPALKQFHPAS